MLSPRALRATVILPPRRWLPLRLEAVEEATARPTQIILPAAAPQSSAAFAKEQNR
jgi:hypothetical protein